MTKWDSHTHTQFCKHGRGDDAAAMVEKAIALGFSRYSVNEHAPLPVELIPDEDQRSEFALLQSELDDYFLYLNDLKKVYGDRIEILSGLEIDYLEGFEDYTMDFLKTYREKLDDLILSLHCIAGKDGLRNVDYTPDDFTDGLLNYYGSIDSVHDAYWNTIKRMLRIDFGVLKTKRLGHIGLINKFSCQLPRVSNDRTTADFFESIFRLVKSNGWTLEFNAAGMSKGYNGNAYLTDPMLYWCKKLDIEIVYGSDAHGVDRVGQNYDDYLKFFK